MPFIRTKELLCAKVLLLGRACPPIRLARGAASHARAPAARQGGGGWLDSGGGGARLSLQVLLDSYALELQWLDRTLVAMRDEIHNTEELLRCVRVCARASVLPLAASSVRACVRACVSTPYARSQLQMDLCARVRRHARARIIMHA